MYEVYCTVKPHYDAIVRVQKRRRKTNGVLRWNLNEINMCKLDETFSTVWWIVKNLRLTWLGVLRLKNFRNISYFYLSVISETFSTQRPGNTLP